MAKPIGLVLTWPPFFRKVGYPNGLIYRLDMAQGVCWEVQKTNKKTSTEILYLTEWIFRG